MRTRIWTVVVALTAALTFAGPASASAEPAGTLRSCDGGTPISAGAYTPRSVWLGSIYLELRYHPDYVCAWGRITGAHPGDGLAVFRRVGNNAAVMVDDIWLPSGGSGYTRWYEDSYPYYMQACALAPDGVYGCTAWW